MALPCIFCPNPASTKEHIIPAWLAKRCGLEDAFLGATTPQAALSHKHPISFKSHRKRFFCQCCQDHFKLLEDDVIPYVEPMCSGARVTLDADAQKIVARWAAKTGFAMIASEAGAAEAVPVEQRRFLREHDVPPPEVTVAFVAYRGLAQKDTQLFSDQYAMNAKNEPRTLYSAFLSFGVTAFKVFGVEELHPEDRWNNFRVARQVWPPENPIIEWPPSHGVTGYAATRFRDSIPLAGYDSPSV